MERGHASSSRSRNIQEEPLLSFSRSANWSTSRCLSPVPRGLICIRPVQLGELCSLFRNTAAAVAKPRSGSLSLSAPQKSALFPRRCICSKVSARGVFGCLGLPLCFDTRLVLLGTRQSNNGESSSRVRIPAKRNWSSRLPCRRIGRNCHRRANALSREQLYTRRSPS
jgi:hypothetical protein